MVPAATLVAADDDRFGEMLPSNATVENRGGMGQKQASALHKIGSFQVEADVTLLVT